jgi:hypothetical protein
VAVALAGTVLVRRSGESRPADAPATQIAALVVAEAPVGPGETMAPGGGHSITLDRHDATAAAGPWTVVVRAADGSFGYHSAIVSYPVPPFAGGDEVAIGGAAGHTSPGEVVWPIAGGDARVRGDLPAAQLLSIATATRIVDGRPVVGGVSGLNVGVARPYRSPDVREVRLYDVTGISETLTFVYTGVLVGGGFEDQVLAQLGRTTATVQGHRAVISAVGGGNATIAWEPAPGVVAYVGYSGAVLDDTTRAALVGVAERTTSIDLATWTATRPQVVAEHNGPTDM